MGDSYHHGDLRRTLLDLAAEHVARSGAASLSLRALAAEAGVSHAAPRYHFPSREALLTALAAEGYGLLADSLVAERRAGGAFLDVGVAYVRFCLEHPGHLAVMFDPDLVLMEDAALLAARERAFAELERGVDALPDAEARADRAAAIAAGWALMHGLVVLERSGALDGLREDAAHGSREQAGTTLEDLARRAAHMLFRGAGAAGDGSGA